MNPAYSDLIRRTREIDPEAAHYLSTEAPKLKSFGPVSGDLAECFLWHETPQGRSYWGTIDRELKGGKPMNQGRRQDQNETAYSICFTCFLIIAGLVSFALLTHDGDLFPWLNLAGLALLGLMIKASSLIGGKR